MVLSENPLSQIKQCKQTTTTITRTTLSRTGDAVECNFLFNVVLTEQEEEKDATPEIYLHILSPVYSIAKT